MGNYVIAVSEGRNKEIKLYQKADLKKLNFEDLFYGYFMINSAQVEVWNRFLDNNFIGLDDDYYYRYTNPRLDTQKAQEEFCNKWLCYDTEGELSTLKDFRKSLMNYTHTVTSDSCYLHNFKPFG